MKSNNNYQEYLYYIINTTRKHNIDNVSRTKAYQEFYLKHPEIKWALLASIVSRNAGWNMTDLQLPPFKKILGCKERENLFMTYERANWLIFSDAYPQLLVYELSKEHDLSIINVLKELHVSSFMIREWKIFRKTTNKERLMIALIINEQNVIQQPVIKQPYFKRKVFFSIPYLIQNNLMLNAVLLPTDKGRLYGYHVHGFTNVTNRITLGKRLASQLFHPTIYPAIMDFILNIEHTGSRKDYERFYSITLPTSPMLRRVYPVIEHQDIIRKDWYKLGGTKKKWYLPEKGEPNDIGKQFYMKRNLLYSYYDIKCIFD
ncbi:DUF2515 family protein [Ornithinibacillus sp. 179-J 7C1 HS]|uniref:DUF2515 family protein n=1 Tax=Ornithinibacillus sp. 179-J 7C1 HS TaxID=3142384 RepID=UPI00399FBAAB